MGAIETCQSKNRYATRNIAKNMISSGNKKWLQVYRCSICAGWHIGHRRYKPQIEQSIEAYYEYVMELY